MKIPRKKDDVCPICSKKVTKKNPWVRYHVRYEPPLVVMACKFCNYTEFCIRNNIPLRHFLGTFRVHKVVAFHNKIGVQL